MFYEGRPGNYTHAMYLDDLPSLAGGRELWGFPKSSSSLRAKRRAAPKPARIPPGDRPAYSLDEGLS